MSSEGKDFLVAFLSDIEKFNVGFSERYDKLLVSSNGSVVGIIEDGALTLDEELSVKAFVPIEKLFAKYMTVNTGEIDSKYKTTYM